MFINIYRISMSIYLRYEFIFYKIKLKLIKRELKININGIIYKFS